MQYIFPDDPFVFRVSAPGSPLYSTFDDTLVVYSDAGASSRAVIEHLDHTTVYQSALMLEGTATIPQFYGPDGVTELWARQGSSGPVFPLYPVSGLRLDVVEGDLDLEAKKYTSTLGAITATIPVTVTHNLGNAFPLVTLYHITSPTTGTLINTGVSVSALSTNALTVTTTGSYSADTVQITVVG